MGNVAFVVLLVLQTQWQVTNGECGIRRVTCATNPVISHEWGNDLIVITILISNIPAPTYEVYGSLSKNTHFSVITQLKDKYQPNWLEKTCFAWRHISFLSFYHLNPDWSNCEFILAYTKTCFFLGVTCYFSRMTFFWSFVLFRCYDFIRSLYYFWTIPKTLIAQHYLLFDIYWNLKRKLAKTCCYRFSCLWCYPSY